MEFFSDIRIIFLSVIIEALPFLFIGALTAAIIEVFVSADTMARLLPKNRLLQMVTAAFLGLLFPICECAIIPVARGLIKKGVPVGTSLVFMLAAPIINPIALSATWFAFPLAREVVLYRAGLGLFIAFAAGLFFYRTGAPDALKEEETIHCDHDICHDHHDHAHHEQHHRHTTPFMSFLHVVRHTRDEFFDVGIYLVMGALFAALFQVLVPTTFIASLKSSVPLATAAMQGIAFFMSLCSHGDAFVAATFMEQVTFYPVLAFLVMSPLIDLKNSIILFGIFRRSFALRLIFFITIGVFATVILLWMGNV